MVETLIEWLKFASLRIDWLARYTLRDQAQLRTAR